MSNHISHGVLKCMPTDFLVTEANVFPHENGNNFTYYILRKCNYSTFEAIMILSNFYKLPSNKITYSGLKDEDGITEQFIALPFRLLETELSVFNKEFCSNKEKYIQLLFYSNHQNPLAVGELSGNNFRIVIRNLDKLLADKVFLEKKLSDFFINYYGPQRFGLPNQEKTTHLIGEYLLQNSPKEALELISKLENEVGYKARAHKGDPASFFSSLDKRQVAFYQSSFYSYKWNLDIINSLNGLYSKNEIIEYTQDHIKYVALSNAVQDKFRLIQKENFSPYQIVRVINDKISVELAKRYIMVQLNVTCLNKFEDKLHPGYWAVELAFFLPSGCYATVAVAQFMQVINCRVSSSHC